VLYQALEQVSTRIRKSYRVILF